MLKNWKRLLNCFFWQSITVTVSKSLQDIFTSEILVFIITTITVCVVRSLSYVLFAWSLRKCRFFSGFLPQSYWLHHKCLRFAYFRHVISTNRGRRPAVTMQENKDARLTWLLTKQRLSELENRGGITVRIGNRCESRWFCSLILLLFSLYRLILVFYRLRCKSFLPKSSKLMNSFSIIECRMKTIFAFLNDMGRR